MVYNCCSTERRELIKEHPWLNGIDFIEVIDNPKDPPKERQTVLLIHFIKDLEEGALTRDNFKIEGGVRITDIQITDVLLNPPASPPLSPPLSPPSYDPAKTLWIKVQTPGDFSTYTLRLIKDSLHLSPPEGFDPVLSVIDFSFKVSCPNQFDCLSGIVCEKTPDQIPNINYLAKDFTSFRHLMLDRLSLLLPDWKERNAADTGVTLVELLAYVGDYLSYQQDAIATEAYLGTARKRISVRRHARLVDYFMHDGSNARTWIQLIVAPALQSIQLKAGQGKTKTKFVTKIPDKKRTVIDFNHDNYEDVLYSGVEIFELMHDSILYNAHNEMNFYTWGEKECCLPKGSTRAVLSGEYKNLKPGDILIFMEVKGPETGLSWDADPDRRHAVRGTEINVTYDPLGSTGLSPSSGSPPDNNTLPVTEIKWHREDALPFPLCISSRSGNEYYDNVSIALGNIVLADHGVTFEDEGQEYSLNPSVVPDSNPLLIRRTGMKSGHCQSKTTTSHQPRYRPLLKKGPLTHAAVYMNEAVPPSATATMKWLLKDTVPVIRLKQENDQTEWNPRRDLLLNCDHNSKNFVVEIETDGTAHLRFGDNKHGARPVSGTSFRAFYRTGNGISGNIGADKLAHIISTDPNILSNSDYITKVWNPMPATGGAEPENIEEARQKAAYAFREQQRAVTTDDYEELTKKCDPVIQKAAANFRWTGSWHTAFITFDLFGGGNIDNAFEERMISKLNRYRLAGQDLEIENPQYVPLEMEMVICLQKDYFASDVIKAILSVFNNGFMPDGKPGLFHPDNLTFGQTLYLSTYYAAAQAIPGIRTVKITKFQRQGHDSDETINSGKLVLNRFEIARLDNDPNYKENGVFNLIVNEGLNY